MWVPIIYCPFRGFLFSNIALCSFCRSGAHNATSCEEAFSISGSHGHSGVNFKARLCINSSHEDPQQQRLLGCLCCPFLLPGMAQLRISLSVLSPAALWMGWPAVKWNCSPFSSMQLSLGLFLLLHFCGSFGELQGSLVVNFIHSRRLNCFLWWWLFCLVVWVVVCVYKKRPTF